MRTLVLTLTAAALTIPAVAQAAKRQALASPEKLVINEIMSANVDEFISPAFNFDGWMELYNPTDENIALAGLYLSDDEANLTKWRIPESVGSLQSKGFRVIWFDSNDIEPKNAPFKLDTDGGTIYLSDVSGKLLVSQSYPKSIERVSYARTTDGGDKWGLTAMASPGSTNNRSTFAEQQLSAPVVDQPSQLYINVGIPAGCTLRYTTDGSLPTMDNGETSQLGQFAFDTKHVNFRFRLFADGFLPSDVTTRSYIYRNHDYMLPVLSLVCDRRFLYDDSIGVMLKGRNGRPDVRWMEPCLDTTLLQAEGYQGDWRQQEPALPLLRTEALHPQPHHTSAQRRQRHTVPLQGCRPAVYHRDLGSEHRLPELPARP